MLVDDTHFVGSLNVAGPYTGNRYGSAEFRDLNAISSGHCTRDVRIFFKNMLLRNVVHSPDVLSEASIEREFGELEKAFGRADCEDHRFIVEEPPEKT